MTVTTQRRTLATYAEVGCDLLERTLRTVGPDADRVAHMVGELRAQLDAWALRPPHDRDEYWSFASNNGMPFEASVAWDHAGASARLYFEPLGDPLTAASCRIAGRAAVRRLRSLPGVRLDRYLRVEDLFMTLGTPGEFSTLNGLMWDAHGRLKCKTYLNPRVGGVGTAWALLAEAMRRFGLAALWRTAIDACVASGAVDELEPIFLALDLWEADASPRVKVYFRHSDASLDLLAYVGAAATDYSAGEHDRLVRVHRDSSAFTAAKPPVTSLSLVGGEDNVSLTTYLPLNPNFGNDLDSRTQVLRVLAMAGLDPSGYEALLDSVIGPDLAGSQRQTYVGYRGGPAPRVSVYIGTAG
jgi:hypothetical protein